MTDTNAIIARSIFLYELENSVIMTKRVVSIEPHTIGISNSICNAIAPPKISASEVDIDAKTALPKTGRAIHLGQYCVAASLRHKPVTIPKCATLCCKTINIIVESVTTHNRA